MFSFQVLRNFMEFKDTKKLFVAFAILLWYFSNSVKKSGLLGQVSLRSRQGDSE